MKVYPYRPKSIGRGEIIRRARSTLELTVICGFALSVICSIDNKINT